MVATALFLSLLGFGAVGKAPVDAAATAAGCRGGPHPGPTPLRRLTRFEYERTVADLFGIASAAARSFPEEGGSGFDNNADVAVAARIHAQKYMTAAEAIAARAAGDLPRLMGCDPAKAGGACVRRFVERFGRRAWRRPLARDEVAGLVAVYEAGLEHGDASAAMRTVLESFLQSPSFLYRVEVGRPVPGRPGVYALDDHEIAARLSYFLWGTMPDGALLRAASRGELRAPAQIAAHARRMLRDERARAVVRRFHDQWLGISLLERMQKDGVDAFSRDATPPLMRGQFDRFVDWAVWQADGRLETLLTSGVTFLNGPLARFLGVPGIEGDAFVKVEAGGERRAGLLTLAPFLAMQSTVSESSPIKRGMFVREELLCQIPPPPPPNMMMPELPGPEGEILTLRERLEDHRADVGCAKCHKLFDPLGLAFEHYDTVGAYRTTERGRPIDATGELVESDVDGAFDGAPDLARRLARSRQVRSCVVRQWFRYAMGRTEHAADRCTLAALSRKFEASGGRIPALLVDLTTTDAFRYRSAEPSVDLSPDLSQAVSR